MNDKDENSLENAFDLTPLTNSNELIIHDAPLEDGDSFDIETARQNVHHLLQKGEYALNEMLNLAVRKQEARTYEVLTNLIKCLSDVNKDLIHIQEKKKQLSIKDEMPSEGKVINQNLFVGSTDELMKIMAKINKEK